MMHREAVETFLKENLSRVTAIKLMGVELQLKMAEVQSQINDVNKLAEHLEERSTEFQRLIGDVDVTAPLAELRAGRSDIKAAAASLGTRDLEELKQGLAPGSSPEQLYVAAVMARARKDPALIPNLTACLEALVADADLQHIRLNTIWTLVSALHLSLVASQRHGVGPKIPREQLQEARAVLEKLMSNRRVLMDRPEAPEKGVRGPAGHALKQIEAALAAV